MNTLFCPNCSSQNIKEISDGIYKCNACGYTGNLGTNKRIYKKI